MWMHFQSCPLGCGRLAELASFVCQFPLPQESHVQHTLDKQHVWFWQKIKNKKERTIIPHKTKKFETMMMSVGHCTQRKPRLCGDPCLVVPFVPKLLAHQIYLLFKMVDVNTEAPWCNGSEERSDCKKSWDTVAISPSITICETTQPQLLATTEVSPDFSGDWNTSLLEHFLNTLWYFSTSLWLPGLGYWYYTTSQFIKLTDLNICAAAFFPTTTDNAFSKLLALENRQVCDVYFNSWVFLHTNYAYH